MAELAKCQPDKVQSRLEGGDLALVKVDSIEGRETASYHFSSDKFDWDITVEAAEAAHGQVDTIETKEE
jgi:hypothetical protein